jgi:arginyl-tRNA synthetase
MTTHYISKLINQTVNKIYGVSVEAAVTHPESQYGDFATNVTFSLSKQLKKPPAELAKELAAALKDDQIQQVDAVGGFINITMKSEFWIERLHEIKTQYSKSNIGGGKKLQVEFISANPTGPTTIGNARGGYIGDTLVRVFKASGYNVTSEYYFNNAGTQISKLVESVKVAAGIIKAEDVQYRGEYIEQLAHEYKNELTKLSNEELGELLTKAILDKWIRPAIKKMNIDFDEWFNERDLITSGNLQKTIDKLRQKSLVYEQDGAVWLDTGKLGVAREARVLIKSNGDPTYLAPDIAYHDNIFGTRGFDIAVKVLGPDHLDQFPSVQGAVKALYPEKVMRMVGHQWFRLIKDGKEVKISKRLGQFVTIEELINEVGADVARFMTLMRSADSHMDFDLDLARERSQKNPYYYVMYSYARAHSIMEQAAARGLAPISTLEELNDVETALVRHMAKLPALVEEIAIDCNVHKLTFFGMEAAKLFHELYESEKIIGLDKAKACKKLYLISQYVTFMDVYWSLLGIKPVQKMGDKSVKA